MRIDLFCHVIDYFGDVAVSYRLAKALKKLDATLNIRFFCSHPDLVTKLYPHQKQDEITLLAYDLAKESTIIADVAIEAFACELPKSYPLPALIINLEYLTAESWIESYHKQESIGMNPCGKKFFFFPSFTAQGSLTHGHFMQALKELDPTSTKQTLCQKLTIPSAFTQRPWLLIYLYDIELSTLIQLLQHFAIIVIGQIPLTIEDPWLIRRYCTQEEFDKLLITSDYSLIRGEDSLSRAILAGKPFLWQAYRQEEEYHLIKVEALCQHLETILPSRFSHPWRELQYTLNHQSSFDVDQFLHLPFNFFTTISHTMQNFPSLEDNLYHFIQEYRSL